MSSQVLPPILQLFSTFHQDAMLAFDLLALIRSLGNVDDTSTFRQLVMPQILRTIM